jgi:hypothetical protein
MLIVTKKILQNTLSMSTQGKLKYKEASKETHNKLQPKDKIETLNTTTKGFVPRDKKVFL